jgi:hypothetical protein
VKIVKWVVFRFFIYFIFGGKSDIFSRVSRAGEVVEGAGKLVEVTDGAGEEKPMILDEISLVEPLFVSFLYSGCSGSCDMPVVATSDVGFVWTEADTVAVVAGPFGCWCRLCWISKLPWPSNLLLSSQTPFSQLYAPPHGLNPSLSLLLHQTCLPFLFPNSVVLNFARFRTLLCKRIPKVV